MYAFVYIEGDLEVQYITKFKDVIRPSTFCLILTYYLLSPNNSNLQSHLVILEIVFSI